MGKKHKHEDEFLSAESEAFLNAINQSLVTGVIQKVDIAEDESTFDNDGVFEKMIKSKLNQKKEIEARLSLESLKSHTVSAPTTPSGVVSNPESSEVKEIKTYEPKKEEVKEDEKKNTSFARGITMNILIGAASKILKISDGLNTVTINETLLKKDCGELKTPYEDLSIHTFHEFIQSLYPTAVFTNDDFVEKFSNVKDFNNDIFIFYQAGEYILAYYVSPVSVNNFCKFTDSLDEEGKIARGLEYLYYSDPIEEKFVENEDIMNFFMNPDIQDMFINTFKSNEDTVFEDGFNVAINSIIGYGYYDEDMDIDRKVAASGYEDDINDTVLPSSFLMNSESSDDNYDAEEDDEDYDDDDEDDTDEEENDDLFDGVDEEEDDSSDEASTDIKYPKKQSDDSSMIVNVQK